MMLVQKPPTLTPSQFPLYSHRRHSPVPLAVVVLPTPTPGLLTLSKLPRPPLRRQNHRQNHRQSPKPLPKAKSFPAVHAPLLNSPAEITNDKKSGVIALPATPSPQPRGRGLIKQTKDRVQNQRRTPSPSYPTVRGKNRRQPSPSTPQPQSEVAFFSGEDLSSGPGGTVVLNQNVRDLFGLVSTFKPSTKTPPSTPIRAIPPFKRDTTSPSSSSPLKEKLSEHAVGYFASSMFQNSPSPEALPDPPLF